MDATYSVRRLRLTLWLALALWLWFGVATAVGLCGLPELASSPPRWCDGLHCSGCQYCASSSRALNSP